MFRYVCTQAVVIVLLFNHIFVFLAFSGGRGSNIFVDSAVTDGRHSYSLTTFDPDGKLGQVERALLAESLGTPIVGVVKGNNIIFASPQILPSPLMDDDGTSRFVVASPQIVLGHSGIASDGRVVTESAQRLAIEHSYTYNEPIPIYLFLEEISLLFQAYTAKPGARPFGCTLLVGYLPARNPTGGNHDSKFHEKPRLFQIDCSGSVVEFDSVAIINGKTEEKDLKSKLINFAKQDDRSEISDAGTTKMKRDTEFISRLVKESLKNTGKATRKKNSSSKENRGSDDYNESKIKLPFRIVSASFSRDGGFKMNRQDITEGIEPLTE